MGKLVFHRLFVLCCVLSVSCRAASDTPANPKEFVETTCTARAGVVANLCTKDLTPFATEIKGDKKRLAIKTVSITKDKIKSSVKLLRKLKQDKNTSTDGAKVVDFCILKFTEGAELIAWTEESLKSIEKSKGNNTSFIMGNVNKWLSDSEANATACVQSMSNVKVGNFVDAYQKLDEAADTIKYTLELVDVYFETLTSPSAQPPATSNSTSSSAGSGSPDPWADFILDACKKATDSHVDQCVTDLQSCVVQGMKMDEHTISLIAVKASINQVGSLVSFMNQMVSDNNRTEQEKQAAQTCTGELNKASARLTGSYNSLQKIDLNSTTSEAADNGIKNVQQFLQDVVDSENVCSDLVKKVEVNDDDSVEDEIDKAMQSAKIALALAKDYFKAKDRAPSSST